MFNSHYKIYFYSFAVFILLILSIRLLVNQGNLFAVSSKEGPAKSLIDTNKKKKQEDHLTGEIAPQTEFIAPDFTFPEVISDKPVSLPQFKGKVVFLNIWATWCGPCRIEMPDMEKLYQKFKKEDFVILAVSIDKQGKSVVIPFMQELGLTFKVLLDPDGAIQRTYMVNALPSSFIIDKTGRIIARVIGAREWFGPETIETFEYLINET